SESSRYCDRVSAARRCPLSRAYKAARRSIEGHRPTSFRTASINRLILWGQAVSARGASDHAQGALIHALGLFIRWPIGPRAKINPSVPVSPAARRPICIHFSRGEQVVGVWQHLHRSWIWTPPFRPL